MVAKQKLSHNRHAVIKREPSPLVPISSAVYLHPLPGCVLVKVSKVLVCSSACQSGGRDESGRVVWCQGKLYSIQLRWQELTTGPGLKVGPQGICRRRPARHDETCNNILIKLPQSNQYLIVMLIVNLCTVFFLFFFSVTYSYVTFQVCNFSGMYLK